MTILGNVHHVQRRKWIPVPRKKKGQSRKRMTREFKKRWEIKTVWAKLMGQGIWRQGALQEKEKVDFNPVWKDQDIRHQGSLLARIGKSSWHKRLRGHNMQLCDMTAMETNTEPQKYQSTRCLSQQAMPRIQGNQIVRWKESSGWKIPCWLISNERRRILQESNH
jgi:hypothetical protein